MHHYTCNNPDKIIIIIQRSEARQNYEHTFKWITLNIQQHTPWLADVQKPKTFSKKNGYRTSRFSQHFQTGQPCFYTTDCFSISFFLRLVTFNSESYSVHIISLCVHVRVPYVRMRQLGEYFTNGRSFLRLITQNVQYRRAAACAHHHLKEERVMNNK